MSANEFLRSLYRDTGGWVMTSGKNQQGDWRDALTVNAINGDFTGSLHTGETERWFRVQPVADPDAGRGSDNTAAVVTLFADFDFAESSSSKTTHPFTDVDDVARFCTLHVPHPVSAVVASGHGCHVYWFLEPTDPEPGAALLKRFDSYLRDRARSEGKDLDAVYDLARVLRIPGTVNGKHPHRPVPVQLVALYPDRIYRVEDFDFLPEPKPAPAPAPLGPSEQSLDLGELPEPLRQRILTEDGNGDRSMAQVYLVHALLDAGLTVDQTWHAVHHNAPTVSKWGNRSDWWSQFSKIVSSHEAPTPPTVAELEEPPIEAYEPPTAETKPEPAQATEPSLPRFETGGVIFEQPAIPDSIWGDFERSLWASGEPFMLYAATGIGKTTIAQRVALAAIGIGKPQVLGYTVKQVEGNVLYIAADRPSQAKRSLRRMVTPEHRDTLDQRWLWETRRTVRTSHEIPGLLLQAALEAEACIVVIDSVKDVAAQPSKDESGQAFNDAIQECVVNGIDVLSLHHPRKASGDNDRKSLTLDDVYGSTWLTAGHGSVIALTGVTGSGVANLEHLKQPADQVGPFGVAIDYETGQVTTLGARDVVTYLQSRYPLHATTAEVVTHVIGDPKPSPAQDKQVRRSLHRAVEAGHVTVIEQESRSKNQPKLWQATSDGKQLTIGGKPGPNPVGHSVGHGGLDTPLDTVGQTLVDPC